MIQNMYCTGACCGIMPNSYSLCMPKTGAFAIFIIVSHSICGQVYYPFENFKWF